MPESCGGKSVLEVGGAGERDVWSGDCACERGGDRKVAEARECSNEEDLGRAKICVRGSIERRDRHWNDEEQDGERQTAVCYYVRRNMKGDNMLEKGGVYSVERYEKRWSGMVVEN